MLKTYLEKIESVKNEVDGVKKLFEDLRNTSDEKVFSTRKQMMEFHVQKAKDQSEKSTIMPVESGLVMFDPLTESLELLGQLFIDVNFSELRCLPKSICKDETIECFF